MDQPAVAVVRAVRARRPALRPCLRAGGTGRRPSARGERGEAVMRPTQRFAINATAFAVASALASGAIAQTVLPTGGNVAAGVASITTNPSSVVVNQTSDRAIINWATFNIGTDGLVRFT